MQTFAGERQPMGFWNRLIQKIFPREAAPPSDTDALRVAFQERYHHFKLLLNANDKALEIMAEIDEALKGTQPFGMNFVKSRCTLVAINVWQIVEHLNELAPGRYEALYERFREIQKRINPSLRSKHPSKKGPLIIPFSEVDKSLVDTVGSKIANLGEIRNHLDLKIPNGFAITAHAYEQFMDHSDLHTEIDRRIQSTDVSRLDQMYSLSAAIQLLIMQAPLPPELETAILEQYRQLEERDGDGIRVALRSSALGEDFIERSFAGQYRSELNVSGDNLLYVYKEIVASKYSPTAMTYRLNRGIPDADVPMCVGCMSMIDAVCSGVIYTASPVNIRDNRIEVHSVWGLPKPVVDGSTDTDLFVISRDDPMKIVHKEIPLKELRFVCYAEEGVCRLDDTGERAGLPSLEDPSALDLARLALLLEEYYGGPQDIEWTMERDGSIILLQCRPLQQRELDRDSEEDVEAVDHNVLLQGGFTASPGAASGPVYRLDKDADALNFPEGAVLVTAQALPRWATLLNRASAVVTDAGGIAGHLANVAREFGVPGLFGLKEATAVLTTGQWITVDADSRRVYEGEIAEIVGGRAARKNLMEGSPIFEALKSAAQHITPLRLLDPQSPKFHPRNCETFHDITRFCHEKVVQEMFNFGVDHHFPERSSKQLYCDAPMRWWVLNLDDGFKEEVSGKYVQLENIVSVPMLAVWEGITAFPWEGPPPVDGKGFMSILFRATTDTGLVTGVRSQYGERNYFMISKNYCSLTSRLGFHFSTIEALVGDRVSENYISFQFKGGAADDRRRMQRVVLIQEILEDYEFRVELTGDHLLARVEDRPEDFMKGRLKILGYLTMHTRQIDMIMANASTANHYRGKFEKDIQSLLQS
jgi:pyruvate,water dikinase